MSVDQEMYVSLKELEQRLLELGQSLAAMRELVTGPHANQDRIMQALASMNLSLSRLLYWSSYGIRDFNPQQDLLP